MAKIKIKSNSINLSKSKIVNHRGMTDFLTAMLQSSKIQVILLLVTQK